MEVKGLHPGQIVVLWVGIFVAGLVVAGFVEWAYSEGRDDLRAAGIVAMIVMIFSGLLITWRWFGARNNDRERGH